MLSETMLDAMNRQINAELYSAYLYQSMSANFEALGLKGFASWMTVQAQEELTHAMRFYNYVVERGGRVVLDAIEKPQAEWASALDAFKATYEHEQKVTSLINNLVELAAREKDYASNSMLQWFVDEQVEEEASADEILQKLKLIGEDKSALFMLDKELGARVFTQPKEN